MSAETGLRHLDIDDDVRIPVFGEPDAHPDRSPEAMSQDEAEMRECYRLLLEAAESYLRLGRSLLLTATFSRRARQLDLLATARRHPRARLGLVWCRPSQDHDHDVRRRLQERRARGYRGAVNTLERYREVQARFEPPDPAAFEMLVLDTFSLPLEAAAQASLGFLGSLG